MTPSDDESNLTNGLIIAGVSGAIAYLTALLLQGSQFRHHKKIEQEYPLYLKLTEELTKLRLALHDVDDDLSPSWRADLDKVAECFNAFKNTLRNNEPVIHSSVSTPAREIESYAREIINTANKIRSIEERREEELSIERDEQYANEQIQRDDEITTCLEEIEYFFDQTMRAIYDRVGPSWWK